MSGLRLADVSHAFGSHRVLHHVSAEVGAGELVCLLGPSGCGKTTLLRIAAGLEDLQAGRVEIDETVVAAEDRAGQVPPERRGVGLMFQDYALFPHLTVRENVLFGVNRDRRERERWFEAMLATMGIGDYADAYPHTLSGGQQQRVALLRALAPEPRVMLLDEPFSGLDATLRATIRADTLSVIKDTGVATLMVTHDPEEAMFMADRILVMNAGRVVQDGTPSALYFSPVDAFVTELFGPVNRFAVTVRRGLAETPVGAFDASGIADGSRAQVLVRPEAFRLAAADSRPDAIAGDWPPEGDAHASAGTTGNLALKPAALTTLEVVEARPLGRSTFIVLKTVTGEVIEARIPGLFTPAPGSHVSIAVNARQAHVFPLG